MRVSDDGLILLCMTEKHPIHTAKDMIDEVVSFELWPFTLGTRCPVSDMAEPHLHDFFVVHFVRQGSGTHFIDFNSYDVTPNTLYFVAPGQLHLWDVSSGLDGYVMAFTEDFLRTSEAPFGSVFELDFFNSLANQPLLQVVPEQVDQLMTMLDGMQKEFMGKSPGYGSILRAQLHILMVNIQRMFVDKTTMGDSAREPELVRRFRKLVADRANEQWSIQQYADDLGVSSSRLNSVIKEATGLTPGQIVRREQVVEAKRLLAHSEMNVSEICFHLNFEDPSYFGRFFKRETGLSPSDFRGRVREKYQHFAR